MTVALTCGLRPGELTGLLWVDLDLEAGTLSVTGSKKRIAKPGGGYRLERGPVKKSSGGERTIKLAPQLERHRRAQRARMMAIRDMWTDEGLVFPSDRGTPWDPSNYRRRFVKLAKDAGVTTEGLSPYTLRHTAASLLIDQGVPVDQVADLLGDDPATVWRHYRHRVRPVVDAAVGPMSDLLGQGFG